MKVLDPHQNGRHHQDTSVPYATPVQVGGRRSIRGCRSIPSAFRNQTNRLTVIRRVIEGRSVMFKSPSPFPAANGQPQEKRHWLVTLPQHDSSVVFMVF